MELLFAPAHDYDHAANTWNIESVCFNKDTKEILITRLDRTTFKYTGNTAQKFLEEYYTQRARSNDPDIYSCFQTAANFIESN